MQLDVKAYADSELAKRTTTAACRALRSRGKTNGVEILSFFSSACAESAQQGFDTRLVAWADYAPDALTEWVTRQRMVGVSLEAFILTPDLVEPLHDAGLTISVGAINDRAQVEPLFSPWDRRLSSVIAHSSFVTRRSRSRSQLGRSAIGRLS